jgi:precorrin-6A/cobalt-precorrin-6A reductase
VTLGPATLAPVLVLGGTTEGRDLATALDQSGVPVISSLAGRVSAPRLPPGRSRSGGFGGIDGLTEFLTTERIRAVVDATHPFAARITANAAAACARTGVPLLVLRRRPWYRGPDDAWTPVPDLPTAAAEIARRTDDLTVLLTTGRQSAAVFRDLPQRFWLRAVDPPEPGWLPRRCELILDRGPYSLAAERELLRQNGIDLMVTKNSGGSMTAAKLTAAREAGVEVLVVERPALPVGVGPFDVVDSVEAALRWLPT